MENARKGRHCEWARQTAWMPLAWAMGTCYPLHGKGTFRPWLGRPPCRDPADFDRAVFLKEKNKMASVSQFVSDKESLSDMLRSVQSGKTQLPDFQRGWVWDDSRIVSLLASVSQSFPIGSVMILEVGDDINFKSCPIEGVGGESISMPERLVLDGQQRITSLFQSIFSGKSAITRDCRGKEIKKWYYINIEKAIDQDCDREESIISVPEDKVVKNFRGEIEYDYSSK